MKVPDLIFFKFFQNENARLRKEIGEKYLELVSGKKIQKPSDDPLAAYNVLNTQTEISKLSQFSRNRLFSDISLSHADVILNGIEDKLRQLYSRTLRASNDILKEEELKAIGKEFEEALKVLVRQANEKVNGNYIFSGDSLTTKPFDENTYDYLGSNNSFKVLISENLSVDTFLSGSEVFGNVSINLTVYDVEISGFDNIPNNDDVSFTIDTTTIAGDSLDEILQKIKENFGESIKFYTYKNASGNTVIRLVSENTFTVSAGSSTNVSFIDLSGIDNVFKIVKYVKDKLTQGIKVGYEDVYMMELAINKVISSRAKIGSILSEVKNYQNYQEDKKLSLEKRISDLTDADMAQSISDYERLRLTYEAVMRIFADARNLTILRYI